MSCPGSHRAVPRSHKVVRGLIRVASAITVLAALAILVPGFFGFHRYVITGGSMSGAFEPGAVVFERDVAASDLRVGDVITYQPPADTGLVALVTHRIAKIEDDPKHGLLLTTKGDANAAADPWSFQIDGATQPKVVLAVDYLGWPLIWLADPALRTILIGVPGVVIFLLAAREFVTGLRRSARQPDSLLTPTAC